MSGETVIAYLGLGSNEGDRHAYMRNAVGLLMNHEDIEVQLQSSVIETAPVSNIKQGKFLNQVIAVETVLGPFELLQTCLETETSLGRVREERWGPRTIDIDILFYGEAIIDARGLTIPHPEVHKRSFMLIPLAEIAPDYTHPIFKSTIEAMLQLI